MNSIESAKPASSLSKRLGNPLLAAATIALWAALYNATPGGLSRGVDRPLCILAGNGGVLASLMTLVFSVITAFLVARLLAADGIHGVLPVALALAVWAYAGGTMDDWLKNANAVPGPPAGQVYLSLIPEYLCLALIFAVAFLAAGGRPAVRGQTSMRDGLAALGVTVVAASILISLLSGPAVSHTFHGQVFFSVASGFVVAVIAARKITSVMHPAWYLPAPFLVGILGLLFAAFRPGLGALYADINIIPANGLVRPLPIEMTAAGIAAIFFTLRTLKRISSEVGVEN